MGEVYRARDTRLDRMVAVKVLPAAFAAESTRRARFEREARAIAALQHPHICTLYDVGEENGQTYLVLEHLAGETLAERLKKGPLPLAQALEFGTQIADALAAAHKQGIVHRDLKPGNVMLTKAGVKLLDFGLARLTGHGLRRVVEDLTSAPTEPGPLTGEGTILGTVPYMAPEQLEGKATDARADLFAFGALMYEMVTGRRAFPGDSRAGVISAIMSREPAPVSTLRPGIPPALDRLLRRCLAKDQDQRWDSAHDLADELRWIRESDEGRAAAPVRHALGSWYGYRLTPGMVAGALILLVLALWGVVNWGPWRTSSSSGGPGGVRMAVLPFENLGSAEDAYFADGMTDEMRSRLASLPQFTVIARGSAMAYKESTKTPQTIARELGVHYLLTGRVRWQKGSGGASRIRVVLELVEAAQGRSPITRWQESFDAVVEDVFRVQGEIATRVAGALKVTLGGEEQRRLARPPTRNLAAYDEYLRGEAAWLDWAVDPATLQRMAAHCERAVALDPEFALAWARLSWARSNLYYSALPTAALAAGARTAAERSLQLVPSLPEGRLAMSTYHLWVEKDNARALDQAKQGLVVAPSNADLLGGASMAERGLGHWAESISYLEQQRSVDPRSVRALLPLAAARLWTRRYIQAMEAVDAGLELAPTNPALVEYKAMILLAQGNLGAARAWLAQQPTERQTANLVQFGIGFDLLWVFDARQRMAFLNLPVEAFGGNLAIRALAFAQVNALERDAIRLRSNAEDAERELRRQLIEAPADGQALVLHGLSLAYLGQRDEAIREGERAVAALPVSRDAWAGAYVQHQLVRIYTVLGERDKALDRLEPLLRIPHYLSPAWLSIDPNFERLKGYPRFDRLAASSRQP
jgi:TolB-like protein/tetratricopeptide (TPR) repeat protein